MNVTRPSVFVTLVCAAFAPLWLGAQQPARADSGAVVTRLVAEPALAARPLLGRELGVVGRSCLVLDHGNSRRTDFHHPQQALARRIRIILQPQSAPRIAFARQQGQLEPKRLAKGIATLEESHHGIGAQFEGTAKASQAPELAGLFTSWQVNVPQLWADIDRTKARQLGVPVQDIFDTMQIYLGSLYVNDFNKFGRTYSVRVQADWNPRDGVLDDPYENVLFVVAGNTLWKREPKVPVPRLSSPERASRDSMMSRVWKPICSKPSSNRTSTTRRKGRSSARPNRRTTSTIIP